MPMCENSSTEGTGVINPQCYAEPSSTRVTIRYSHIAQDKDVWKLCGSCAKALVADARRWGYKIETSRI